MGVGEGGGVDTACCTHIGVEAKLTDVARNHLLFLWRDGDSKCVVDYSFLDGIHLEEREHENTFKDREKE